MKTSFSLLSFRTIRSRVQAAWMSGESACAGIVHPSSGEGHDFSRAEKAFQTDAASAAEGRPLVTAGGSSRTHGRAALQGRVSGLEQTRALAPVVAGAVWTLKRAAEKLCFWVAQRFSAAIKAPSESAALAAEVKNTTSSAHYPSARRRNTRRVSEALLLATAVFLFLGAGPSTESRFNNLGHRMMCTCGCGQVLLECNHVGCQSSDKMRNELMAALTRGGGDGGAGSSGESDDLILQGFVQEYGPTVIAAPTSTGFNKVAWIMPFVALAAGIVFVTWVVRAWKNRPEPALADGITIPKGEALDHFRAQARKETDV